MEFRLPEPIPGPSLLWAVCSKSAVCGPEQCIWGAKLERELTSFFPGWRDLSRWSLYCCQDVGAAAHIHFGLSPLASTAPETQPSLHFAGREHWQVLQRSRFKAERFYIAGVPRLFSDPRFRRPDSDDGFPRGGWSCGDVHRPAFLFGH